MACPDILPTILEATQYLQTRGIAYLHLVEADWDDAPQFTEEFRQAIRARFTRPIIVAGRYDKVRAEWVLSKGYADLVAFGRPFLANPDLPHRLANDLPLATFDSGALFGGGERGYSDYPNWRNTGRAGEVRKRRTSMPAPPTRSTFGSVAAIQSNERHRFNPTAGSRVFTGHPNKASDSP